MAGTISNAQWLELEKALSTDRLSGYRHAADADFDRAAARYLWNTALCEALYPVLHCVEVSLRNRLDQVLCRRYGANWIANAQLLGTNELRRVANAKDKLNRRGKTNPSHADVVAELNLGFWVSLFTRFYERPNRLWPAISGDVLSGAPRALRTRATFYTRLDRVRDLRNRAFHYEPLWHWADLDVHHSEAREMLEWLSPEVADLAAILDRFTEVRSRGVNAYECLVEGGFVCPIHNGACRLGNGDRCPSAPAISDDASATETVGNLT
jgi:hypothetical protein